MSKAKALYVFNGDANGGEMSFVEGEILTIINKEFGGGWWEAMNSRGEQGFVPQDFLQDLELDNFPPAPIPVPTPVALKIEPQSAVILTNLDSIPSQSSSWDPPIVASSSWNPESSQIQQKSVAQDDDAWSDDGWSDEENDSHRERTSSTHSSQRDVDKGGKELSRVAGGRLSTWGKYGGFVKMGGDQYLTGSINPSVRGISESDILQIQASANGPVWVDRDKYTCKIYSPKKEYKRGIWSFIVYQIVPSFSNAVVSRRYKHFDWLHKQLCNKFPCVNICPLPEKQMTGRFEDDFILDRMRQLQEWLDRMTSHPVISGCDVLQHFLTCTDDKRWKAGKRRAEKDEFQGIRLYLTLRTPNVPLNMAEIDVEMEKFGKFVKDMDEGNRNLLALMEGYQKRCMGPLANQYRKIGNGIDTVAKCLDNTEQRDEVQLARSLGYVGEVYRKVGDLYATSSKTDLNPFIDSLVEYKGLLVGLPDVVLMHKASNAKFKECQKLHNDGDLSQSDMRTVTERADTISYASLAEKNNFRSHFVDDYRSYVKTFLSSRITFYQNIVTQLEGALHLMDQ